MDIQVKSITYQGFIKIGVCEFSEQAKPILLGPELKTETEIDQFIDELISQLNKARVQTKKQLKEDETNKINRHFVS